MRGRERYRRQWSQSAMPLALEIVEAVFSSILVESSLPSPSLLLRQGFSLKEQKQSIQQSMQQRTPVPTDQPV